VTLSVHGDEEAEVMRFSNDGAGWTPWERYRPLREWRLEPGAGRRTVHVEVRRSGHVERVDAEVFLESEPDVAAASR